MRSPVIAFGLFAAAVSPTIVSAAPAPKQPSGGFNAKGIQEVGSSTVSMIARQLPGLPTVPGTPDIPALHSASDDKKEPADDRAHSSHKKSKGKRAYDWGTAGGNAYTGATGSASGGSVINHADGNPATPAAMMGTGTLTNAAGTSVSYRLNPRVID